MTKRASLLLAAICLAYTPQALACSTDFDTYKYAKEIKARPDVRRLEGTFIVDHVVSAYVKEREQYEGKIFGRVQTKNGHIYPTIQDFTEIEFICLIYPKPAADAEGKFYITRSKAGGAYQMLLWEGHYTGDEPSIDLAPLETGTSI